MHKKSEFFLMIGKLFKKISFCHSNYNTNLRYFFAKQLLSYYFGFLGRLVFNQSSPVPVISESRGGGGGSVSVAVDGGERKSLCLILDRLSPLNSE